MRMRTWLARATVPCLVVLGVTVRVHGQEPQEEPPPLGPDDTPSEVAPEQAPEAPAQEPEAQEPEAQEPEAPAQEPEAPAEPEMPAEAELEAAAPPPAEAATDEAAGIEVGAAPDADATIADEAPLAEEEEIVVTGSRIKRSAFSSASPVEVVTREELQRSGYTEMADLARNLNEGSGNTSGSFFENQGVQMINLRGLGGNATLILVNGRRLLNGGVGTDTNFSDVSTIPIAMIERIEILRGGASAVYGSDAVAGVINIITTREFDGTHIEGNVLTTDNLDHQQYEASISAGASNETSGIGVGLNWFHSTELLATDRDWTEGQYESAIGPVGLFVPVLRAPAGGSPYAADIGFYETFPDPACPDPDGWFRDDHTQTIADLQARLDTADPSSEEAELLQEQIDNYQTAQRFQGAHLQGGFDYMADPDENGWWPASVPADDPRAAQKVVPNGRNGFGCGWQTRPYEGLRPQTTRVNATMLGTHSLTDHLDVDLEMQYANARTRSISPHFPPVISQPSIAPSFAYNANLPWTSEVDVLDASGNPTGMTVGQTHRDTLYYGYPFDFGADPNRTRYDSQTFRSVLALSGDFEAAAEDTLAEDWEWQVAGSYARNTWNVRLNDWNIEDVDEALDACNVDAMGNLIATNPGDPDMRLPNTPENRRETGCFNPFYSRHTDPDAANSPDTLDEMLTEFKRFSASQLYTLDASLGGTVMELPGGDLGFALGSQYRHEVRRQDYDHDTNVDRVNLFSGITDSRASRDIWAGYGELLVPFMAGIELEPALRYERYDDAGDALTPKVGLVVSVGDLFDEPPGPIEGLRVRGVYAQAFRAANLAQTDPSACSVDLGTYELPRTDRTMAGGTTNALTGGQICGNPDLVPETSDSYNVGIEWAWEDLLLTGDFWEYRYRDRIVRPDGQLAVDQGANRFFCLTERSPETLMDQSAMGQAVGNAVNDNAALFTNVNCDAIAGREGIEPSSLTPDEYLQRYTDIEYSDATGNPINVLIKYENASKVVTRGIDFGLSYMFDGETFGTDDDIGTLALGVSGTYLLTFKFRQAPPDPEVDCSVEENETAASCEQEGAGKRNSINFNDALPRLRFRVPVTYTYERHQFAFTTRYIGGFEDDGINFDITDPPDKDVDSFVVFDFQYALSLNDWLGTPATWRIGVQNIFDAAPPRLRDNDSGGFDPSLHDSRGRRVYTRFGIDL